MSNPLTHWAKQIAIKWVPIAQMVADGFTKELSPAKHFDFIKQLNIVDVEDIVKGGLLKAL
jgi:UDP-3-O-acyl-N-acetylglucosamine deacetylase